MCPRHLDAYQFYGNASERVIIYAVATNGALDTAVWLYPPGGGPAEATGWMTGYGGDSIDHQLAKSGLYSIVVADYGLDAPGAYYVSLTKIPPGAVGICNPYPANGSTISSTVGSFQWDAVPGVTGYDLYFGTGVVEPLAKVGTNFVSASFPFSALTAGCTYAWHVVGHTASGDIEGPYWQFAVSGLPLQLTVPTRLANGSFQLSVQGLLAQPVRLQASTNLIDWETLSTLFNLQSSFDYVDTAATNFNCRFYRAVTP